MAAKRTLAFVEAPKNSDFAIGGQGCFPELRKHTQNTNLHCVSLDQQTSEHWNSFGGIRCQSDDNR